MMADDDNTEEPASPARPGTSRKVPGGFGVDDEDDLSPTKPNFADAIWRNTKAHTLNHARIPSLDAATLPSLPPGGSSFLDAAEYSEGHFGSTDEREMRRHLMDIESSILAPPSPLGPAANPGADDTYLFHGGALQPSPAETPISKFKGKQATVTDPASDDSAFLPSPLPSEYKTPGQPRTDVVKPEDHPTVHDATDSTSSLETMSSSPTAAAVARSVSRALSVVSGGYETAHEKNTESEHDNDSDEENEANDYEKTPKNPRKAPIQDDYSSDERSTLRFQDSNQSLNRSADAGSTPGAALLNGRSSGRRPRYLRSRMASQRSSISSFVTNPDSYGDSDLAPGVDYALQSGGAVPIDGQSRNSSYMLSRAISLGSMASGIGSIDEGDDTSKDRVLATLDEEERNRQRYINEDKTTHHSPPETPRGTTPRNLAPTGTVIAQHVRNVQVPESMVKEYRTKNGLSSPGTISKFSAPSLGRAGKNLTLKEQSSTIERLSKENWDLKLKVFFLNDRISKLSDKLSEEGVKEMVNENVELRTALTTMQVDNKALRKKIKELEKKLKAEGDRPDTAGSGKSSDDRGSQWFDQNQEREEELIYLRERVEEYVTEIEKLRNEGVNREGDKRKLAELVRTMGEKRGENVEAREEMDVWKDLLEQETARREQSDEDNRKLREEINSLKFDNPTAAAPSLNHTTQNYYIMKKRQASPSRPRSVVSDRLDDRTGAFSAASTLVEELRKETEQLRHENAELRREVGAQTSMLTSRNREKERLYQEIEDLKLRARGAGGSIAGTESIFERSASRAHERSLSRASGTTKRTAVEDNEREDLENKNAELRDKINAMKLEKQELQRELDTCMEDFEIAVGAKKEAEALTRVLQEDLEAAENDLQTMQADRDEALKGQEEVEIEFEGLRKEAQEEIDALDGELAERNEELERLQADLNDRSENFNALQAEMRSLSESLVRLEDDHDAKSRRINELEQELEQANREIEEMEKGLLEANGKVDRLTVQQESSQGEIAFLREEQDGDKIKIGDLQAALKNAEDSIRDGRERVKELEQRLASERHQRDLVAGKEKQEVQKLINDLNRECSTAKDEARRMRKNLTSREVEATEWKERLMELENNLREALGDLNGTRSSLLKSIAKLQRELENTVRELDNTKAALSEKDRLIQQRDVLLESHSLESRRLSEMLDKERQAHRNTKHQHETFLTTHQHTTRTITQQESRVIELENGRQQDRKKITSLENNLKDQMLERNNLLLTLWNRLSALCGTDWTNSNHLINGRALPSLETISTMLPGFSKNLLAAVKTIESIINAFPTRVRSVENSLWKEYQNLEHVLETRTKRLSHLETLVKTGGMTSGDSSVRESEEIHRLREVNRTLKERLDSARKVDARTQRRAENNGGFEMHSPAPHVPTGPRGLSSDRTSTLTRHHSASVVETLERTSSSSKTNTHLQSQDLQPTGNPSTTSLRTNTITSNPSSTSLGTTISTGTVTGGENEPADQKWIFRLRELERRLKAEREARLLDRSGARKRLEEEGRKNEELRGELERVRVRREGVGDRVVITERE